MAAAGTLLLLGLVFLVTLGGSGLGRASPLRMIPAATALEAWGSGTVLPFEARASDGTVLRGHVFLPPREGPLATVLDLSPYWNTAAGHGASEGPSPVDPARQHEQLAPFLEAGFALAAVNIRGTGGSDGCFQWGGQLDWSDAYTVVETLARQPWSNGKVGMYGLSYDGWTQYMALAKAPPSLKAVVPVSGVIDVWSLLTRRGAVIDGGESLSTTWRTLYSIGATEPQAAGHAACLAETDADTRANAELVRSGDRTEYFQTRDLRPFISNTDVAVFATNGMVRYAEGHILQFEGLWDLLRPDRSRLLLGQWGHGFPTREDWPGPAVAWFDHYLRGGPHVVSPGTVEYQDDSGGWHTAFRWPPSGDRAQVYLSEGALVADRRQVTSSAAAFPSARVDPGYLCGPHQVLYASPPLAEGVLLAGNFFLDASMTSTLPGGNLVAVLYQTPGDGSCSDLGSQGREVGRAQLDLRHWLHPGSSRDFPTNQRVPIAVEGEPFASLIPAGHRLVLAIGGGSLELLPDPYQPVLTVSTGPSLPGSVTLPVVEGSLRFQTGTGVRSSTRRPLA